MPWKTPVLVFTFLILHSSFFISPASAGRLEQTPAGPVLHLTIFDLPDPSRTDPATRAELAVQREFLRRAPDLLRARQAADPARYGNRDLSALAVRLHRAAGIKVEGVESTLLAIAGNVAPDVLYVNFRQSDTYVRQGFLHPLDLPADRYFAALPPEEVARRIHPKIEPVVRRPGPDGATHVWAMPGGPPLARVVLFRRDLFDAAGVPAPKPDWTWDDFHRACRAIADPARGVYALGLSRGKHESYLWMPFLWGVGGDALAFDDTQHRWRAVFDSPAAAEALDYVEWVGPSKYVTARGKEKDIVTGIPSPMFWRRWKRAGREIRAGYVTLRKLGKAQWEVVLWLNRETLPEAIARGLLPSEQPATVPEPIPAGECPF